MAAENNQNSKSGTDYTGFTSGCLSSEFNSYSLDKCVTSDNNHQTENDVISAYPSSMHEYVPPAMPMNTNDMTAIMTPSSPPSREEFLTSQPLMPPHHSVPHEYSSDYGNVGAASVISPYASGVTADNNHQTQNDVMSAYPSSMHEYVPPAIQMNTNQMTTNMTPTLPPLREEFRAPQPMISPYPSMPQYANKYGNVEANIVQQPSADFIPVQKRPYACVGHLILFLVIIMCGFIFILLAKGFQSSLTSSVTSRSIKNHMMG